ncbi:hypothetical protein KZ793_14655 [Photorhabdus sp. UCH-936]|uniref:hypothetical protein n=1 Tax=Photorhabdus antumapuensis TaxID=2862867 RepID=UPI0030DBFA00|nr:hypothetical protein [Photorhabdus antumapuensis]
MAKSKAPKHLAENIGKYIDGQWILMAAEVVFWLRLHVMNCKKYFNRAAYCGTLYLSAQI